MGKQEPVTLSTINPFSFSAVVITCQGKAYTNWKHEHKTVNTKKEEFRCNRSNKDNEETCFKFKSVVFRPGK